METASRTLGLTVAHAGAPGVDGPSAKAGARWGVGAHCPVTGLRAPRYCVDPGHGVDTGHAELRPGLALWGVERLQGVVRAAVAAAARH